uniref:Uncharacterized protein n=1 Tax=Panagrolaimus sp. PS1159 TaxID=55785 RepID=A0AC35G1A3_9BILA
MMSSTPDLIAPCKTNNKIPKLSSANSHSSLKSFKNVYIPPISTVIPSIYKPLNILLAYNGFIAILAGIDLTTIFICNHYFSTFGISLFGPFYFFHWMTICSIVIIFALSIAETGKIFAVIPYLSITIYRLVTSCIIATEFNQNPQKIFDELGISSATVQICAAFGFFIFSNLVITVIHGYFAFAGFCYFLEEIVLNVLQKRAAENHSFSEV